MNQTPQSELHPSAEMLNAFSEQALGAQEREQMTAHLAGCGRCREVVFLAQEAALAEERFASIAGGAVAKASTQGETEGLFRLGRWFGGWHLAWVGGLAAACMVFAIISVRLLRPVEAPKTARVQPQPAVAVQAMQAKVESAPLHAVPVMPKPKSLRARKAKLNAPAADKPVGLSVDSDANASAMVLRGKDVEGLPINGRNTQTLQLQASAAPQAVRPQQQAAVGGVQGLAVQQRSAGGPSQVTQFMAGQLQAGAANRVAPAKAVAAAPVAAAPSSSAASSNATVAVSATTVDALSDDANAEATIPVMVKKAQPLLPGNVAAVSSAEWQGHRVAVDVAGHLFLSNDAGVTWQAVASQWTGRAMSVKAIDATGFELVNENGAVWSSVDGLIWKPKP